MPTLDALHLETLTTDDGSATLRRIDLNVTYRSSAGAKGESEHVFMAGSRITRRTTPWRVLELGFGLGTNLEGLIKAAKSHTADLVYVGLEADPIPWEHIPQGFAERGVIRELLQAACTGHASGHVSTDGLNLSLYTSRWQDTPLVPFSAHAIFFDPFGPETNPDCWSLEAFEWAKNHLAHDGILATYGAAGHVRRAMRDAGLVVATAPGYGPKREMTLASPSESALEGYKVKYRP